MPHAARTLESLGVPYERKVVSAHRTPDLLFEYASSAEERGLRLVTANGEADLATDGGRMYARIKAAVARAEVERKGKRQSRAQQQRAEKGRPPRGVRATGYTLNGEVIADEAAVVAAVFAALTKRKKS